MQKRLGLRPRLLFSALLAVAGLAAIAVLSVNVTRDLRLLESAQSDNVQWTLSQTEVEFLEFERMLLSAGRTEAPDLSMLRREFDIFYSRIGILGRASIYAPVRDLPEFSGHLNRLQAFLDENVDAIDGSDADLVAALPTLTARTNDIRGTVRKLSTSGLNYFAKESDQRRARVSVTLNRLAFGVTVLMVALLLLVFYLGRLNRLNVTRSNEALQASRRMNIVTSTSLDAVIVADLDGKVLDFNAAAEQIFGYSASEAIGGDLGTLIVPDHHRDAHEVGMARMRSSGEKRVVGKGRIRLEAQRADGTHFPVEIAIQSAETENGEIFISFLRDISQSVEAERELVEARDRAMAGEKAKTEFLATMSHEIRTPLNGLLGNLALLHDTGLSAKQTRYIKNMDTSGRLLMSHVSDVLDITKYDAGKLRLRPVSMNISTLLQDIVDNQSGAASAQNTTLGWGWLGAPVHWVHADKELFQHVLMNIIGNAVKFTKDGQISVEISSTLYKDAEGLQIIVQDTGIGINPDQIERIFGDFMTGDNSYARAVGGTGLGLGIARRFVEAMGGEITVQSVEGAGSRFCMLVPYAPVDAPDAARKVPTTQRAQSKMYVLLVEDNEINRVVAREMLIAQGHRVTEAHNGQAGVAIAAEQSFDLILMDISMPIMDGRAATRAIRAGDGACAKTPIVALTANAMAEEQEAFLSDGMNEVLTKPLSRKGLIEVLSHYGAVPKPVPAVATVSATSNQHLMEMHETLGAETTQKMITRFMTEADETLLVFGAGGDMTRDELAAHAHRLAGSAATLGAADFREALLSVEVAAKAEDGAALEAALLALPARWEATKPLLKFD